MHASVALRRREDFKGSGLSLRVYPDGTVILSTEEFPPAQATAATTEELGRHTVPRRSPTDTAVLNIMEALAAKSVERLPDSACSDIVVLYNRRKKISKT